jgi:hypothetical protein
MANLTRFAKHGSKWTKNDLRAYNIEVVAETVATFFGNANLPPSTISPAILAHEKKKSCCWVANRCPIIF